MVTNEILIEAYNISLVERKMTHRATSHYECGQPGWVIRLREPYQLTHDLNPNLIIGTGFIRHTPDDDAGMIFIPGNHSPQCRLSLIQNFKTLFPLPANGFHPFPFQSPPVKWQLLHHHEAKLVEEI